jgi:ammonia channel protein AmtB
VRAAAAAVRSFLVFFMQVGFVALEAGSGRAKNVRNILLKNMVDVMVCGLCWWLWGFAFAYGDTAGGFIGRVFLQRRGSRAAAAAATDGRPPRARTAAAIAAAAVHAPLFLLSPCQRRALLAAWRRSLAAASARVHHHHHENSRARRASRFAFDGAGEPERAWFFSFTFALVCVTIVSGALAERTHLLAYPAATVVIATAVHPVAAHWAWSAESWLQTLGGCRFLDFAGGAAVHMVGGTMALIGAWLCGPRLGRFEDGAPKDIPGHDMTFVTLGASRRAAIGPPMPRFTPPSPCAFLTP